MLISSGTRRDPDYRYLLRTSQTKSIKRMSTWSSARWWIFYGYIWHYWPAASDPNACRVDCWLVAVGWRGSSRLRHYWMPFLMLLCFRFRCAPHDAICVDKAIRFCCCCCSCCFYNISIELTWQFQSIHSTKLHRVIYLWQHSLIPQQIWQFPYEIRELCRNTAKNKDWN